MNIKEAIEIAIDKEKGNRQAVADKLDVSVAMVSHYIKRGNHPRLGVAARLWGEYSLVVDPFTEVAIIKEWTRLCQN